MPRIVSLIASATEIVHALGFGPDLVGRSHECDHPPSVQELPVCTEPRFDVQGSSAEIDRRVKAVLQDAISVYRVHSHVLDALRPDVIVTQSQCEVCAVSLRDVEEALCRMVSSRPRVVALEPHSLADVWDDIRRVAQALGARSQGEALVARLQERMEAVARRARGLPERPRVACIEWLDPLMAAGNWVPELVERAGGRDLFGRPGHHSPWMTWEQLLDADPDIIVCMPCGFDIPRTLEELPVLARRPGWSRLRAVQTGRVYVTDGNAYFNRPGPRLVESLEILAELLHPQVFAFGHQGSGWVRVDGTARAPVDVEGGVM